MNDSSPIRWDRDSDGIVRLILDAPERRANVFDEAMLTAFEQTMEQLEQESDLTGVLIETAKDAVFVAGADLQALASLRDPDRIRELSWRGQRIFARIAALPCPTVACIHGAALGGGCELALACDWRLASPDRSTRIGLPETQLGILPAWGGCTRLPRLLGLRRALDLILGGKRLTAIAAKRCGLVDALVPRERLSDIGRSFAAKGKRPRPHHWDQVAPFSWVISSVVGRQVRKKSGGHYPALEEARRVIVGAGSGGVDKSLEREREALVQLMGGEVFPHLLRIFFLREEARHLRLGSVSPDPVEHLWVIGAGVMGAGITQWHAAKGTRVWMRDVESEPLTRGMQLVAKAMSAARRHHVLNRLEEQQALERVHPVLQLPTAPGDLVIEAATEQLTLKQKIFADLEAVVSETTLLATNTSALQLSDIAANLRDPGRLIGIHYFNPVARMPLVEVVRQVGTPSAVVDRALAFVQSQGKIPLLVGDGPGFLVNRMLMPYLVEAGRLLDEGVPPAELDAALEQFGMPMGPARLLDEIGLDVAEHVVSGFQNWRPDRYEIPACLTRLLAEGRRGRKSGGGIYDYDKAGKPGGAHASLRGKQGTGGSNPELCQRCLDVMVREAAELLEDGIVAKPDQVDLGMVLGTGFAPFRGGPLRWADAEGVDRIVARLDQCADRIAPRFAAGEALARVAARNGFYATSPTESAQHENETET